MGLAESGFSAAGYRFAGFFVGGTAALGLALIPLLLAFGERKFDFNFTALEIDARWNEGESLLLGFANELANFFGMHEKFARANGGMVGITSVLVGADVAVQKPEFVVFDQAISVFKVGFAGTNGFDLGTGEDDACFKFFEQEIVMTGVPIDGRVSFAGGGGLATRILLPVGLGLMSGLLSH